jgi:predicted Zn finger-like uncharacterized protein
MIINCDACSASLQMDETKIPVGKFTIRCPKCRNLVRIHLQRGGDKEQIEKNENAKLMENKDSDSTAPQPAPVFKASKTQSSATAQTNDFLKALSGLLQQAGGANQSENLYEDAAHNVLICLPDSLREAVMLSLNEAGWKTYVAEKPTQALETLEDMRIGTLIYSSKFAQESRGAFAIESYLFKKVPSERRKTFVVLLSDEVQTCNAHEAFLKNLNLVVNTSDAYNLPLILRRSRRAYDEIYRHFNKALAGV